MPIKLNKPFTSNSPADPTDIINLKRILNKSGYYIPDKKTGINAIADANLVASLKNFQTDQNLSPTGTIKPDDKTEEALNEVEQSIEDKYRWRSVGDENVRPGHAALDGEIRDWSEYPGPGEEPNCRCWAEPLPKPEKKPKINECIIVQKKINDILKTLSVLEKAYNYNREKVALIEIRLDKEKSELKRIQAIKTLAQIPNASGDLFSAETSELSKLLIIQEIGISTAEDPEIREFKLKIEKLIKQQNQLNALQKSIENKIAGLQDELLTLEKREAIVCQ